MGASLVSPMHLVLLAVACLLLFGAKRLPEIGRSLGTGMREFKDSVTPSGSDGIDAARSELPPPLPTTDAPVLLTTSMLGETIPVPAVSGGNEREARAFDA